MRYKLHIPDELDFETVRSLIDIYGTIDEANEIERALFVDGVPAELLADLERMGVAASEIEPAVHE